jgi:hypothetical protein
MKTWLHFSRWCLANVVAAVLMIAITHQLSGDKTRTFLAATMLINAFIAVATYAIYFRKKKRVTP